MMLYSKKRGILLQPNRRCATASLCKNLQLKPWEGEWGDLPDDTTTVMVVRDPTQRFLSTCEAEGLDWESVMEFLPKWRKNNQRQADPFIPQSSLLRKFDYLIGLPWVAEWLNEMKLPGKHKEGVLFPIGRPRPVPDGLEDKLMRLYPRDYKLLGEGSTRVPLWTPNPDIPRFIFGNCSECAARARAIST